MFDFHPSPSFVCDEKLFSFRPTENCFSARRREKKNSDSIIELTFAAFVHTQNVVRENCLRNSYMRNDEVWGKVGDSMNFYRVFWG